MSDYLNLPGNEPANLPVNLHQDTFEWALQKTYDFARLMSCYRCAMMEIESILFLFAAAECSSAARFCLFSV